MNATQRSASLKRWRGVIVELVYDGHRKQESRMDALVLWGLMRDLGHDVSQNDVLTLCQDLKKMGFLDFQQERLAINNEVRISQIELTGNGLLLAESEQTHPLVRILR